MQPRLFSFVAACIAFSFVASPAQERSLADQRTDDLNVARAEYVLKTRAYSPEARQRALALLDDARMHAGELTKPELHLRLLEIVALADNGHDVLTFGSDLARPDRRMPYRVAWFPDALIIVRAVGQAWELAGGRIEAIDDVPVSQLYQRLSRFAGGVESQRKLSLGLLLESPQLLNAAGVARRPDRLTLKVRLPARHIVERTLVPIDGREIPRGFGLERLLAPEPIATESGWTPALSRDTVPLAFREGNSYFRLEPLLDGAAMYVQFRINFTFAGQDIDAFQQHVVSTIELQRPRDIVLDLRFNTGGDLQSTLAFMRALPERVPGRVFVLISRYTFSAGIVSAAAVKKAGGDKVTVVGEPAGDRLRFWSEGGNACLPNSGFCLHYTDGLFDMGKGCAGEAGCYGDQFDVNVRSLQPDVSAPLTADDYLAGRDRAMEVVMGRLR